MGSWGYFYLWGELSYECGASCVGASSMWGVGATFTCGASCLMNVGRVVLGQVLCGACCLWGELSIIVLYRPNVNNSKALLDHWSAVWVV